MCELLTIGWLSARYLFLALASLEHRLNQCDTSPGSREMIGAGRGILLYREPLESRPKMEECRPHQNMRHLSQPQFRVTLPFSGLEAGLYSIPKATSWFAFRVLLDFVAMPSLDMCWWEGQAQMIRRELLVRSHHLANSIPTHTTFEMF